MFVAGDRVIDSASDLAAAARCEYALLTEGLEPDSGPFEDVPTAVARGFPLKTESLSPRDAAR